MGCRQDRRLPRTWAELQRATFPGALLPPSLVWIRHVHLARDTNRSGSQKAIGQKDSRYLQQERRAPQAPGFGDGRHVLRSQQARRKGEMGAPHRQKRQCHLPCPSLVAIMLPESRVPTCPSRPMYYHCNIQRGESGHMN